MSKHNTLNLRRSAISLAVSAAITGTSTGIKGQQLEEIVVTARKRTQDLQDVPLHVQAFDNDDIREKMLRGFQDYAKELTSISFGTSSPGATTIAFRGTISQPTGFDTISSSTLYLDEIPITRDGQNPDVRLYDVERLEALSGPQPTVYGQGSQSGTLKIVTNKPDTEEFGGWVNAGGGLMEEGDESYDVSGAVNIPFADQNLAVRLVGFYEREGGYVDNVLGTTGDYSPDNGTRDNAEFVDDDINHYEVYGGRAFVRWLPNVNWTIDAGVVYQRSELGNMFDFNPAFGDLNTIKFKDENDIDEWYNLSLTAQGDIGFADMTVAVGYHERKIDYDLDATAYMTQYKENGLGIAYYYTGIRAFLDYTTCNATAYCYNFVSYNDFGPDPTALISLDQEVKSFVTEIRLNSKDDSDSRFNWLLGAFYEDTDNDWDYITVVDDFAENGGAGAVFTYYGVAPTDVWFDQGFRDGFTYNGLPGNAGNGQIQEIEQIAVFGEAGLDITDTLNVTAGGRWFETERRLNENSLFIDTASDNFDVIEKTSDFSPRINLTWTPNDDILLYYTYSEGLRVGGFNGGAVQNRQAASAINVPLQYGPDKLKNHEIGIKSKWFNGRVLANMTAFTMNWEDYQINVRLPIAGATTVNAGNASIDGVEGQFGVSLTEKLQLSGNFTYIDARIDDDILLPSATAGVNTVAGNAGDALPVVPEWKFQTSLVYSTPMPWEGFTGTARFDFSHVGESVNGTNASVSLFGASTSVPQIQPAYQLGNLRFSIESGNDWETWLSINNVWDERAITYIWPRFGDNRAFTVRPREFRIGFYKEF